MAGVLTGEHALRILNHHIRQHQQAGATPEDLVGLQDVAWWIRGMVALDRMGEAHESGEERPAE